MNIALITGASSGIGLEFARIFARNKCDVVLVARSEEKLTALADELKKTHGVKVKVIAKDLADKNAPSEIKAELDAEKIEIEYLINNAGFGGYGLYYETDWKKENDMIQVNVTALAELSKIFVKEMVKRNSGRILNVASTAAFQPGPLMSVYYAGKAFVLSLSEAMAYELKDTKVTVTCLCPGPTKSNFQNAANINESGLVKGRKIPSSYDVALFGYNEMMKGKYVAIEGFMNKFMAFCVRFMPRKMVLATVYKIQRYR
ncbi:MAG: SDR family oxidoreductase [Ignavibacteria bacterium]|nr:SDR family oxidoreductase [Ignavibacteria bacterium]